MAPERVGRADVAQLAPDGDLVAPLVPPLAARDLRLEGGVDDGCRGSHGVHVRRRAPLALDGPGHRVRAERRASVQLAPGYVAMDEAHHGKLLLLEVKGRSVGSSAIDRARELRCARQGFSSRCSLRVLLTVSFLKWKQSSSDFFGGSYRRRTSSRDATTPTERMERACRAPGAVLDTISYVKNPRNRRPR